MNVSFITKMPFYVGLASHWFFLKDTGLRTTHIKRERGLLSFQFLIFLLPLTLFITYFEQQPYFQHYNVPAALCLFWQMVGYVSAVVLGWNVVWLFARSQRLEDRFWTFVFVSNCFALFWGLASPLVFVVIQHGHLFTYENFQIVAAAIYLYLLAVQAYIALKVFGCSPFVASGLAIINPMIATIINDFVNIKLYGVARPNEEVWFSLLYNSL